MTMQHQNHPDDVRLSALAGGDPEATGDTALRAHLESCVRCTSLVRELGELRVALAQLPDVRPSRRLQLVPPVPESADSRRGGWLRRLAAPVMAAGAAVAVVGAVGFGAAALGSMAASGGAPIFQNVGDDLTTGNQPEGEAEGQSFRTRDAASSAPAAEQPESEDEAGDVRAPVLELNGPGPWLVVFGAGVLLLLLGVALRDSVNPRAG